MRIVKNGDVHVSAPFGLACDEGADVVDNGVYEAAMGWLNIKNEAVSVTFDTAS